MVIWVIFWFIISLFPLLAFFSLLLSWKRYRNVKRLKSEKPVKFIAFFHPNCSDGGGGERVLWTAIKSLQMFNDDIDHDLRIVIYTREKVTYNDIIKKVLTQFGISITKNSIEFVYLRSCFLLEARYYPHFTILGQSIGSIFVALEALILFPPHVFVDTTGCAFSMVWFRYIGLCRVACYIHYPTISTDMIKSVDQGCVRYNNKKYSYYFCRIKVLYYFLFAKLYGLFGFYGCNLAMVNSSWTFDHIQRLWYSRYYGNSCLKLIYPPCSTSTLKCVEIDVKKREDLNIILSVGQFRPEKEHNLQLQIFRNFLDSDIDDDIRSKQRLLMAGSVRNDADAQRVKELVELAESLKLSSDQFTIETNISYERLMELYSMSTIGLHTMWNEHFGIAIVEYMSAGLIPLVHKSGGPLADIVKQDAMNGGYLANTVEEFVEKLIHISKMSKEEKAELVKRARKSCDRFSEESFIKTFSDLLVSIV